MGEVRTTRGGKKATPQEKWEILLEALGSPRGPEEVCFRHGISLIELRRWLTLARGGALERLTETEPAAARAAVDETSPVAQAPTPVPLERPDVAPMRTGLSHEDVDAMFSMAAHELKEPLRGARALTRFLVEDHLASLNGDAQKDLETLSAALEKLQVRLEGLTEYARAGQQRTAIQPVPLTPLLEEVRAGLLNGMPALSGVVLIDPRLPVVRGDRSSLGQLFRHLLHNALRYNQSHPPRVEISALPVDSGAMFCTLLVRDNGIGIEPRYHKRIFELYQRLHSYDQLPGAGVGLTVARRIAQVHGGSISVDSDVGRGSTFRVTLPVQ